MSQALELLVEIVIKCGALRSLGLCKCTFKTILVLNFEDGHAVDLVKAFVFVHYLFSSAQFGRVC